jgi:hypothetical protein
VLDAQPGAQVEGLEHGLRGLLLLLELPLLLEDAEDARALLAARLLADRREGALEVRDLLLRLAVVRLEARPHPRVARLADHLLQPLQDLLLGVQQVAQIVLQELLRIGDGHGFARGSGRGREGQGSCR